MTEETYKNVSYINDDLDNIDEYLHVPHNCTDETLYDSESVGICDMDPDERKGNFQNIHRFRYRTKFLKLVAYTNTGTNGSDKFWVDTHTGKISVTDAGDEIFFRWNVAKNVKHLIELFEQYTKLCLNKEFASFDYANGFGEWMMYGNELYLENSDSDSDSDSDNESNNESNNESVAMNLWKSLNVNNDNESMSPSDVVDFQHSRNPLPFGDDYDYTDIDKQITVELDEKIKLAKEVAEAKKQADEAEREREKKEEEEQEAKDKAEYEESLAKNKSNKTPDDTPIVAPDKIPDEIPDVVPGEIPDVVPDEIPDVVPDEIPDVVPDEIPDDEAESDNDESYYENQIETLKNNIDDYITCTNKIYKLDDLDNLNDLENDAISTEK